MIVKFLKITTNSNFVKKMGNREEYMRETNSFTYSANNLNHYNAVTVTKDQGLGTKDTYYFYAVNDHLGAVQKLVAGNGAVVWSMGQDVFGRAVVSAGSSIINNLRFSSQYFDAESGLHYNTMRYYDPGAGRYLNRDPIGDVEEDEDEDGLYHFVLNNPFVYVDLLGLKLTAYPIEKIAGMQLQEKRGLSVLGLAVSPWPPRISKIYLRCCVRIKGELKISLYYNPDKVSRPEEYTPHRQNYTVAEHERWHARNNATWWNKLKQDVDPLEKCYRSSRCANAAAKLAEATLDYYNVQADMADAKFDNAEYGKRMPSFLERTINNRRQAYENAKQIFQNCR